MATFEHGDGSMDIAITAFFDLVGLVSVRGRTQFADELFKICHLILVRDHMFIRLLIADIHRGEMKHMRTNIRFSM